MIITLGTGVIYSPINPTSLYFIVKFSYINPTFMRSSASVCVRYPLLENNLHGFFLKENYAKKGH